MFKDDYRFAMKHITASDELKKKTLERAAGKKASPQQNRFVRYGLVCASFLFVMAMFPVLYGNGGLTSEHGPIPNATMPQTGVDDTVASNSDALLGDHYKSSEKILKELNQKKEDLNALIKERDAKASEATLNSQPVPEHIDNKIQAYEKEIKEIEEQLSSEIYALTPLSENKIVLNEISQPVASAKIRNFAADTSLEVQEWTQPQIVEYLEVTPIPSYIPEDLTWGYPQSDETFTQKVYVTKADKSLAYDTFSYSFAAPQLTRELNPLRRMLRVDVSKEKLPVTDCLYLKEESDSSVIFGVNMKLGVSFIPYTFNEKKEPLETYEMYVAEFIHNNVGYRLVSSNLTQLEFTDVVSSIIIPKK